MTMDYFSDSGKWRKQSGVSECNTIAEYQRSIQNYDKFVKSNHMRVGKLAKNSMKTSSSSSSKLLKQFVAVFLLCSLLFWCFICQFVLSQAERSSSLSEVFYTSSTSSSSSSQESFIIKQRQQQQSTAPQQILYRIIGNDLPPRHDVNQSIKNLQFMLKHEELFPDTQKVFVLNRIVDQNIERQLIRILETHIAEVRLRIQKQSRGNATFHVPQLVRLPFQINEYKKHGQFQYSQLEDDFQYTQSYRSMSNKGKQLLEDYVRSRKNQYLMNNNGARNWCIEDGNTRLGLNRRQAHNGWILPLDGNSYFTRQAWTELGQCIQDAPRYVDYLIVPMQRVLDNRQLLDSQFIAEPLDEPQVVFRTGASQRFHPDMRYGRRSKVELLWRLGVVSREKQKYSFMPWEKSASSPTVPDRQVMYCSWVARLFSGKAEQESTSTKSTTASKVRSQNRMQGILNLIQRVDSQTFAQSYLPQVLISSNSDALEISSRSSRYYRKPSNSMLVSRSQIEPINCQIEQVADNDPSVWVARLFSGKAEQESTSTKSTTASKVRSQNRLQGILNLIQRVDSQTFAQSYLPQVLISSNTDALEVTSRSSKYLRKPSNSMLVSGSQIEPINCLVEQVADNDPSVYTNSILDRIWCYASLLTSDHSGQQWNSFALSISDLNSDQFLNKVLNLAALDESQLSYTLNLKIDLLVDSIHLVKDLKPSQVRDVNRVQQDSKILLDKFFRVLNSARFAFYLPLEDRSRMDYQLITILHYRQDGLRIYEEADRMRSRSPLISSYLKALIRDGNDDTEKIKAVVAYLRCLQLSRRLGFHLVTEELMPEFRVQLLKYYRYLARRRISMHYIEGLIAETLE
ncbi:hypothetical protein MP228_011055 [Amoeboaphelidium protococcarum]|nr:hypothetical protein MP228_011055 [Amoeboaphelidium protococcarum]